MRLFPSFAAFRTLALLAGLTSAQAGILAAVPQASPPPKGLDRAGMDTAVLPGDDFFAYANGAWLKATPIPADRGSYRASTSRPTSPTCGPRP